MNFEYLYRLYGFIAYENIDVDDDETRERLHNNWLTEKAKFFPNGIVSSVSVTANSSNQSYFDENKNENESRVKKNLDKLFYGNLLDFDNPFLKKAKKYWNNNHDGDKPRLEHIGNNGSYEIPEDASESEQRKVKLEKNNAKETRNLFYKDLKNRGLQLIYHFIYAISFIMISFIHIPNTKEYFKKGCITEFPDCHDTMNKTTNFFFRLALMNQSEPIRWIKSIPAISVIMGFSYLLNCRRLLYSKTKTETYIILGVIFALFFGLYLCYQLFLLTPMHHENTIGCCISRRIWASDSENYMFVIAIAMTIVATPLFLSMFLTYAGVVPFILVLFSFIINYKEFNLKIFDDNEGKLPRTIFLIVCSVALFLLGAEGLKCVTDYYRNDSLSTFNDIVQSVITASGYFIPFLLVAFMTMTPNDVIKPVVDNSNICSGKCREKDELDKPTAVQDKFSNFFKGLTNPIAKGIIEPFKKADRVERQLMARKLADAFSNKQKYSLV